LAVFLINSSVASSFLVAIIDIDKIVKQNYQMFLFDNFVKPCFNVYLTKERFR